MEKRRIGPKATMKGLPKASLAKVNFLTLPKPVESDFVTGYNLQGEKDEDGKTKWQMNIDLLEHPNGTSGLMLWQTTSEVIRKDIMYLVESANTKEIAELEKDLFQKNYWGIESDKTGIINLVEL